MTAPGCPFPDTCPVPDRIGRVRSVAIESGSDFHTVYAHRWEHLLFNADGSGNARFSPIESDGVTLGAVYLARHPVAALLETAFHDITPGSARIVSHDADLAGRGLRRVTTPQRLLLADLRDPALARMGLDRSQVASSSPAHYGCTRVLADSVLGQRPGGQPLAGIMWNSRVAEIAVTVARPTVSALLAGHAAEVCVLFDDRPADDPLADFQTIDTHPDLTEGVGHALVYDLADQLDAIVM